MDDKPSNKLGLLLHRSFMTVGSLLLAVVLLIGIAYGSNAAFDYATTKFDGSCLMLDSGADLCIKRDSPPVSTSK